MTITPAPSGRAVAGAFTLIELLVVMAIVALLLGMVLPALGSARATARTLRCATNQKQMVTAWMLYADVHWDRAMPLAYWSVEDIGSGEQIFWWGSHGTATLPPDHAAGFISPFLDSGLREASVFECPDQPWESYRPQGPSKSITSTYGYNGYYLSPAKTPGWAFNIGHRPWRRIADIHQPSDLFVFADTLLPAFGNALPGNTALLDPPMLFSGGTWSANPSPTTAFRHGRPARGGVGKANAAMADGSVQAVQPDPESVTHAGQGIGSATVEPGPGYVPDWRKW